MTKKNKVWSLLGISPPKHRCECAGLARADRKGVAEEGLTCTAQRNTQAWSLVETGSGVGCLAGCQGLWMSSSECVWILSCSCQFTNRVAVAQHVKLSVGTSYLAEILRRSTEHINGAEKFNKIGGSESTLKYNLSLQTKW